MSGAGPALLSFNPTLEYNDQFPKFNPGEEYEYGPNTYRYVLFNNGAGNVAATAGSAAYWKTAATFEVTSDKSDSLAGSSNPTGVAGVFVGAPTDGYYTWLQTKGFATLNLASGDSGGAVGNKIFAPASDVDLTFRSEADSSVSSAEIPATELGRQYAAGVSNTALCRINVP